MISVHPAQKITRWTARITTRGSPTWSRRRLSKTHNLPYPLAPTPYYSNSQHCSDWYEHWPGEDQYRHQAQDRTTRHEIVTEARLCPTAMEGWVPLSYNWSAPCTFYILNHIILISKVSRGHRVCHPCLVAVAIIVFMTDLNLLWSIGNVLPLNN